MHSGWVKHRKYGSRSYIRTSHSARQRLQITTDPHTNVCSVLTVATLLFSLAVITQRYFLHCAKLVPSFELGISKCHSTSSAQKTSAPQPHFSSRVQKFNILFLRYVMNAWPRLLLLSVQSMLVLWHVAVLQGLTTVAVRSIALTL